MRRLRQKLTRCNGTRHSDDANFKKMYGMDNIWQRGDIVYHEYIYILALNKTGRLEYPELLLLLYIIHRAPWPSSLHRPEVPS